MKLSVAAQKVEESIEEMLTYMNYPTKHWNQTRTNNTIERVNREIKRRTKAIGAFSDGQSALMLVCAQLHHVAASNWGSKRYLNMNYLFNLELHHKDLLAIFFRFIDSQMT
jgi:Transposase and inactivated derivatives